MLCGADLCPKYLLHFQGACGVLKDKRRMRGSRICPRSANKQDPGLQPRADHSQKIFALFSASRPGLGRERGCLVPSHTHTRGVSACAQLAAWGSSGGLNMNGDLVCWLRPWQ